MTADEKADVLHRSLSAIEQIESVKEHTSPYIDQSIKSTFVSVWYSYVREKKFVPAVAIAAVLLVVGSTSIAAERSLPGDSLYSLKVNVNEQVQGFAAITPEAKAKFALEVTDKRLKEATLLSARGKLNAETGSIIQKQLVKQAGEVKNRVASLASTNKLRSAQEVAVNFESSLKTHELILGKISTEQASSSLAAASHIGSIIDTLRTEIATTTVALTGLNTQEISTASTSMEKVNLRFAETKEKFIELQLIIASSSVSTSTASTTGVHVTAAAKSIASASSSITAGNYAGALTEIQKALQYISDAMSLIMTEINAETDVKGVVNDAISNSPVPNVENGTSTSTTSTAATSTVSSSGSASA